jgi:hypothetical protein
VCDVAGDSDQVTFARGPSAIIFAGFAWFICLINALRFSWVDGSQFIRRLVGFAAPLGFAMLVILGGYVLAD